LEDKYQRNSHSWERGEAFGGNAARLVTAAKQFRFARRVYAPYTRTAGIIDDQTRQDNLTDN